MRMPHLPASLLLIVTASLPVSLSAQRANGLRVGLSDRRFTESATPAAVRRDVAPTHWQEGMIIGGVVGIAVGAFANGIENLDDSNRVRYSTFVISMPYSP